MTFDLFYVTGEEHNLRRNTDTVDVESFEELFMAAECRARRDTLGCCLIAPCGQQVTLAAVHTYFGRNLVQP